MPDRGEAWIVVTSISRPTAAIHAIARCCQSGWSAVVVGDTKTPADWHCDGITYLSIERQRELFGPLADLVPYRHYCRKNLGYLYAIEHGAKLILETDDDNIPYDGFGHDIQRRIAGGRLLSGPGWVNVYRHFCTGRQIWPRGLPLDAIHAAGTTRPLPEPVDCPIQQYLADNDPDVDAIYRLTTPEPLLFDRQAAPVVLDLGTWVPFNSQNTLFFADAFPLLYLPCHVSFRMTDIWRSFVAQVALHRRAQRLAFRPATVEQIRNEHDLMRDFADEVVGYLRNRQIMQVLQAAAEVLPGDRPLPEMVGALWLALIRAEIVPAKEQEILDAWLQRLGMLDNNHGDDDSSRSSECVGDARA